LKSQIHAPILLLCRAAVSAARPPRARCRSRMR
jgi:hypothetical protein